MSYNKQGKPLMLLVNLAFILPFLVFVLFVVAMRDYQKDEYNKPSTHQSPIFQH
jgi:hypothetical protein